MIEYIKKLRSKPENTRKQILAVTLACSMSVVVLIWVYSLGGKFSSSQSQVQAKNDIKPFKLFATSLSDTYKNISASVGKISTLKDKVKENQKQIDLVPVEHPAN